MQKNYRISFWLRLWFFWILYFLILRIVFIIYNYSVYKPFLLLEKLKGFWNAIPLDLSAAGYLIALPTLLIIGKIFSVKFINRFNYFLIFLIGIINITDTLLYHEWGSKLNAYALSFLFYPSQMLASVTASQIILSIVLSMVLISLGIIVYQIVLKTGIKNPTKFEETHYSKKSISRMNLFGYSFLMLLITFLAIRGGVGLAPINQSSSYYSFHAPLNHLATNTSWNLLFSVLKNNKASKQGEIAYYDATTVEKNIQKIYHTNPTEHEKILSIPKPNVVLVILESYTADVIETLGGEKGITPYFSKLTQEGMLFENIYSTGDRTDKGIVAVLSGYPAQSCSSIIKEPSKFEKLPSLASVFKNNGYTTSVYYGGESEFANFKAYWKYSGYNTIIDEEQFDEDDKNSKWGAHDHVVFEKVIKDLNSQQTPFFTTVLTLSCHEPFETPIKTPFDQAVEKESDKDKKQANLFRKAAYYTDWSIQKFMESAKKQSWFNNTLFLFVADHGNRLPKLYSDSRQTEKYRIPLLLYGNPISKAYLKKRNSKIGSQTDIATTLLGQLNMDYSKFKWGKDLLNPTSKDFAFYCYDEGMTWIMPKGVIRYVTTNETSQFKTASDKNKKYLIEELPLAKSYLQALLNDYAKK